MSTFEEKELAKCKTIEELDKFVKKFIQPKSAYDKYFLVMWKASIDPRNIKRWDFKKASIQVWSYMLQKENPVYLGKTSDKCRTKLSSIHGMECSGH